MFKSSPPRRGCFSLIRRGDLHQRVFPASAGVFPHMGALDQVPRGLPRLGGGVSMARSSQRPVIKSSPPRRGCFLVGTWPGLSCAVFPASAGVFPCHQSDSRSGICLPRLGGGVSRSSQAARFDTQSSPPRRGCFRRMDRSFLCVFVFPASAGVFLRCPDPESDQWCFPRLGGGFSKEMLVQHVFDSYSPSRRGCFI